MEDSTQIDNSLEEITQIHKSHYKLDDSSIEEKPLVSIPMKTYVEDPDKKGKSLFFGFDRLFK